MTGAANCGAEGLMVDEAYHRFCNGLQMIMSTTNGIIQNVGDPHVRGRLAALQDRILLLANVNRSLSGPFGRESVSASALSALCNSLAACFDRPQSRVSIHKEADPSCPKTCELIRAHLSTKDHMRIACRR